MKASRLASGFVAALLVTVLGACSASLPATVVPGTRVTVGWGGELTSLNAAADPTPGNLDIAEATRGDFGDVVDGEFVPEPEFGTVSIVGDDPFTVRYDLAEPAWSDGIPLDAADLMLAWAASAGILLPADGAASPPPAVPALDEFARAIEVTRSAPTSDWQTAIDVAVPAHVVGRRALGLDDPMQAKQAVIEAIENGDGDALAALGETWSNAFAVTGTAADIPTDVRVSSGPFHVSRVALEAGGQTVALEPNPSYRGASTAQVARIDLVPPGDNPALAVGSSLDVAELTPTAENRVLVRDLERRDNPVLTTHDGTVWAVLLRPAGVFAQPNARVAFLRSVPARDLVDRGAGEWSAAYSTTTSMLAAPGSAAFDIVSEDSGFATTLGTPSREPALDREAAGVAAGAPVCVLYDRASQFASGAFTALRDAIGEAGWNAVDCGSDDIRAAFAQPGWDAAIVRVPLPATPTEIAAQWGSGRPESLVGSADAERDVLIAQLAQTVDVYESRELLALIESTIVRAAVARPLAVNPRVTIADRAVGGVSVRNGSVAPLLHGVAQWATAP